MTVLVEFVERWSRRRDELQRVRAQVDAGALLTELLDDLQSLTLDDAERQVTLQEASELGGYSVDHLQRLVASGVIPNAGRKGAPRMRRADVPVRAGHRPKAQALTGTESEDQLSVRRRMTLDTMRAVR